MTQRIFTSICLAAVMVVLAGCYNPFKPPTTHQGAIRNGQGHTLCQIMIDGEVVMTNLAPGEVRICPKRLEGGRSHDFYATAKEAKVYHVKFTKPVDDLDDQTFAGFHNLGWWWDVGRQYHQ